MALVLLYGNCLYVTSSWLQLPTPAFLVSGMQFSQSPRELYFSDPAFLEAQSVFVCGSVGVVRVGRDLCCSNIETAALGLPGENG